MTNNGYIEHAAKLKDSLDNAQMRFLVERHWEHTCVNPGSLWLWQKALPDGRTVVCKRPCAIELEIALSRYEGYNDPIDNGENDEEQ